MKTTDTSIQRREPGTRANLPGKRPRSGSVTSGRFGSTFSWQGIFGILHCSIWRSTASSGRVTWSGYGCAMSVLRITFPLAPSSFNRRRSARSSSKSPRRREMQFPLGSNRLSFNPTPICFQAGSTTRTTFRRGNTHESSMRGSQESVWTLLRTAHTLCVVQSHLDLSTHQAPTRRATAPWTYQARKHGAIPWHRSRRCS
jgi:hypothetical protein